MNPICHVDLCPTNIRPGLRRLPRPMRCLALVSLMGLVVGCGDDGLGRFRVTGKVTYKGAPVEAGMIMFEPTASAGAVATTSYLAIKDGKYDAGSDGPTKGKYRVIVGGFDRKNEKKDGDGTVFTPNLFPDYTIEVDIPPPNNQLDIEVPASLAK